MENELTNHAIIQIHYAKKESNKEKIIPKTKQRKN